MNLSQIEQILADRAFPDPDSEAELVETHISWVILTANYAFKIKKPLKYPFLDFSTLAKRQYYCERELVLNRRFSADMYIAVIPVRRTGTQIRIGGEKGRIIDYAVQMKRQDTARQMNVLLEQGRVAPRQMQSLARQLAAFHARAEIIREPLDLAAMREDFADISKVQPFIAIHLGEASARAIAGSVEYSDLFLDAHQDRLGERIEQGFIVDGHGDLHSKNIFLPADGPAVIFDCIEFSDHFRRVDVLNELAFFCMDLDFYRRPDLASTFLRAYSAQHAAFLTEEDRLLFHYYKLYRANVRVKINALKTMQSPHEAEMQQRMKLVRAYLQLLEQYLLRAATSVG